MKRKITTAIAIVVLSIGLFKAGMVAGAATGEPGSASDPLITQSYLEEALSEVKNSKSGYQKVTVAKGKTIYLEAGTTAILTSGSGTVSGKNGLINISAGELFNKDHSLVMYQTFLSPDTSSGMKASKQMVCFVAGKYLIK